MIFAQVVRSFDIDELCCSLLVENVRVSVYFTGTDRFKSVTNERIALLAREIFARKCAELLADEISFTGSITLTPVKPNQLELEI